MAREESANLILDRVKTYSGSSPAVIVGDFNSTDRDSAYKTVPCELVDISRAIDKGDRYGQVTRGVRPRSHGVLHSRYNNITFSDHRPVVADMHRGR